MLEKYLDDLESRINPETEDKLLDDWKSFWDGKIQADIFIPQRDRIYPAGIQWPDIQINSTLDNYELMALHQLKMCSDFIGDRSGRLLNIRCNYGTGILSSLFGAGLFIMDDNINTLPTTLPLEKSETLLNEIINKGIPDIQNGLGKKVFEMGEIYLRLLKPYPNLSKYVNIFHPDIQSPMDISELLIGSDLFIALIEEPELVKQLLELITRTYITFLREWLNLVPSVNEYSTHWAMMQKGTVMLRDDSAMNLSPDFFEEFILPYDQKILTEFNGGAIHFCGRGDHFIEIMSRMEKLYAINLSQPEYNNMETIFKNTVDKNIRIIGLKREAAEKEVQSGRDLKRSVQCW